jgi:SAM-dependent methyltransferase
VSSRPVDRARAFWRRTGHRDRLTAQVRRRIADLRGVVVDIGGGRDAPHDDAWDAGATRIRVDLSPAHAPDVVADALRLPFADERVDAVAMFEVLEHVARPWEAIEEAWRVLRPSGTLLGSAPLVWPIHGDPDDYYRFTEAGLRELLRRFEAVSVIPIGNHYSSAWILVAARSRVARSLNPLLRGIGRREDRACPEGYVFSARRS